MAGRGRDVDRAEEPDVEIGAAVSAKRLRFRRGPETDVRVHGEASEEKLPEAKRRAGDREAKPSIEVETASGSHRENLPDEVEPGTTYRNVRVGWRAAARIRDADDGDTDE
jgi:hypothetical protein